MHEHVAPVIMMEWLRQACGVVGQGRGGVKCIFYVSGPGCSNTILMVDVSPERAVQRLDTETQIEDRPPLCYAGWPPTSQNFLMAH